MRSVVLVIRYSCCLVPRGDSRLSGASPETRPCCCSALVQDLLHRYEPDLVVQRSIRIPVAQPERYAVFRGNVLAQRGIPLAIYSDRHPVFKFTGDIDRYPAGPTQLARAMEEMGIRQISDRSPQAKGRVERAAGTFQDRLVAEIRLAGAATNAAANEVISGFLPRFNREVRCEGRTGLSCLPLPGAVSVPRSNPLLQTPPQGVPGQHRQVQPAHAAAVA